MSVTYLGGKSLGAISIGTSLALPALLEWLASLVAKRAELTARLDAYANLTVSLKDPATMIAEIKAAILALEARLAAIALEMVPNVSHAVSDVNVEIGLVLPQIEGVKLVTDKLKAAMSAGGLHLYRVDGAASELSGELAAHIGAGLPGGSGPSGRLRGVLILTEDAAADASLGVLIATS